MTTLVRWQRRRTTRGFGSSTPKPTLWHVKGETLNDRYGRTGCGKRYPRKAAKIDERGTPVPDDDMCALCLIALESEPT